MNENASRALEAARRIFADRMDFWKSLVSINSHSRNGAGVDRNADIVERAFAGIGFSARRSKATASGSGSHVLLEREGQGGPVFALCSHLDTVYSEEEEERERFRWSVEGDRVYGPGTNDCKGGTAMILVVLETLAGTRPDFFRRSGWKVLLDATEETDLADFARFSRNESRGCAAFLVFEAGDHSGSDWKLVTSRKGRASYRIEVEGKGAHPGVEHERGANAIVEAARVISRLAALTDYASGLTVNPGLVSGGNAVNRVPDRCVIETELRAFDPDALERACAAVEAMGGPGSVAAADGSFACRIGVTCTERDATWPENRGTDSLFAAFSEAATGFGLTLAREARGGLSDGNALAGRLPVIDGLGPSGDNCHCAARAADGSKDAEYANLGDFAKKAALVAEGIAAFASCDENCRGNS